MAAYEGETCACAASSDLLKITQYRRCHTVYTHGVSVIKARVQTVHSIHTHSPDRSSVFAALCLVAAPELSGLVSIAARHSLSRRLIRRRQLPFKLCYPSQRFVSLCLCVAARLLFL